MLYIHNLYIYIILDMNQKSLFAILFYKFICFFSSAELFLFRQSKLQQKELFPNQNANGRNFLLKEAQLSHEFARSLTYFFSWSMIMTSFRRSNPCRKSSWSMSIGGVILSTINQADCPLNCRTEPKANVSRLICLTICKQGSWNPNVAMPLCTAKPFSYDRPPPHPSEQLWNPRIRLQCPEILSWTISYVTSKTSKNLFESPSIQETHRCTCSLNLNHDGAFDS